MINSTVPAASNGAETLMSYDMANTPQIIRQIDKITRIQLVFHIAKNISASMNSVSAMLNVPPISIFLSFLFPPGLNYVGYAHEEQYGAYANQWGGNLHVIGHGEDAPHDYANREQYPNPVLLP
jgi:hypothetical protein